MPERRTMRRHVIVSQGGKTGAGGTFLRDQNVSADQAEHIPKTLVDVVKEPGTPTPPTPAVEVPKPSVLPPTSVPPPADPTSGIVAPPGSAKALRRWSESQMLRLAKQEGIEAKGLDKGGLRALLGTHFKLR